MLGFAFVAPQPILSLRVYQAMTNPKYYVTEIKAPGGYSLISPKDVNSSGVVVGSVIKAGLNIFGIKTKPRAAGFIYRNGEIKITSASKLFSVNDSGIVYGNYIEPDGLEHVQTFDLEGRKINSELRKLSIGYALNDIGDFGGKELDRIGKLRRSKPFIWQDGTLKYLPLPVDYVGGQVNFIDNNGAALGTALPPHKTHSTGLPVKWEKDEMSYLPLPKGYESGYAQGVDQDGRIFCNALYWNLGAVIQAAIKGVKPDITEHVFGNGYCIVGKKTFVMPVEKESDPTGDANVWIQRMTANGQIVGVDEAYGRAKRAFVLVDDVWIDLNRFIENSNDWYLSTTEGVSTAGHIVGRGKFKGNDTGFLLTPIS